MSNGRTELRGALPRNENQIYRLRLGRAVMPEVDHGISERFERIMHLTEALEAKQQAAELVFPRKDSLYGSKSFCKNFLLK